MVRQLIKRGSSTSYGTIQRGCSIVIPVYVRTQEDKPIDLTDYKINFTVKRDRADFDRYDDFAYIVKEVNPQYPKDGHFEIPLTSTDLDFEPGKYFFDIQVFNEETGLVARLVTLEFTLEGGPSNRLVNAKDKQFTRGQQLVIVALAYGEPIVVISPAFSLNHHVYSTLADLQNHVQYLEDTIKEMKIAQESLQDNIHSCKDKIDILEECNFDMEN